MREKLLSYGDDSWIEDESGARVFKVNGKAMRIRNTFVLRAAPHHKDITLDVERRWFTTVHAVPNCENGGDWLWARPVIRVRIEEVRGSIPRSSTTFVPGRD